MFVDAKMCNELKLGDGKTTLNLRSRLQIIFSYAYLTIKQVNLNVNRLDLISRLVLNFLYCFEIHF